jgi:translation elongation factor EF-Ts
MRTLKLKEIFLQDDSKTTGQRTVYKVVQIINSVEYHIGQTLEKDAVRDLIELSLFKVIID